MEIMQDNDRGAILTEILDVDEVEYLEVVLDYGESLGGNTRKWGFIIYAKINNFDDYLKEVALSEGTIDICSCYECGHFGEQVVELYGLGLSLSFIKKHFTPVPKVNFVVDCQYGNILLNDPQDYFSGLSHCPVLDGILMKIKEACIDCNLGL